MFSEYIFEPIDSPEIFDIIKHECKKYDLEFDIYWIKEHQEDEITHFKPVEKRIHLYTHTYEIKTDSERKYLHVQYIKYLYDRYEDRYLKNIELLKKIHRRRIKKKDKERVEELNEE